MEGNKENILSHTMRSGFFLGVAISLLNILDWSIPIDQSIIHKVISIVSIFVTIFCISHFTRLYQRDVLNDEISFGKAYSYGIRMFFFAAMIIAVVSFCYFTLNPDAMSAIITNTIETMKEANITDSKAIEALNKSTAKDFTMSILWEYTLVGLFVCLFTSFLFRKKNIHSNIKQSS